MAGSSSGNVERCEEGGIAEAEGVDSCLGFDHWVQILAGLDDVPADARHTEIDLEQ